MIFPRHQDRGVVVFLLWNELAFAHRLLAGTILLLAGLALQAYTARFWPGLPCFIAGTLLFLVRGFDNRVDFGRFEPDAQWERVEPEKIEQLLDHDRRMARWDRSALDVTNGLGSSVLLLLALPLGLLAANTRGQLQVLVLDALVLLVPHWLTGTRSVMRQPNLILKAKLVRGLLDTVAASLTGHKPELLLLLQGNLKIPVDLKLKVTFEGQPPDFLGLYGQVVINRVQGKPFPYFYVVLVARPNAGLRELNRQYQAPDNLVAEFKLQPDVEVLVLRQHTTKTSGYHTKPATMQQILAEGVQLARQIGVASLQP